MPRKRSSPAAGIDRRRRRQSKRSREDFFWRAQRRREKEKRPAIGQIRKGDVIGKIPITGFMTGMRGSRRISEIDRNAERKTNRTSFRSKPSNEDSIPYGRGEHDAQNTKRPGCTRAKGNTRGTMS